MLFSISTCGCLDDFVTTVPSDSCAPKKAVKKNSEDSAIVSCLSGTDTVAEVVPAGIVTEPIGYFSPLAGTLFATVTNASQISRNLDASMDYLAIFFMACMYVGFLNSYLYLMVFLIRFLRGEKVDYDVAGSNNNNTSGYGHLSLQSMDSEDLDHFVDDVDGGDDDDGDVEIEMVNGDVRSNV